MGRSVGSYRLSVQHDIAPPPDGSPEVVDWLPLFSGFSWVAYGTQRAVVITMAPSPSNTGEADVGGFFRQILSLDGPYTYDTDLKPVTRVCWGPKGISFGTLAAAAGKQIHVYEPRCFVEGASEKSPDIPFTWARAQVLEHTFNINSFSWSESGDGVLSVGQEIVMWHKEKESWTRLWRSPLEQPQGLSAASWSARGIAASADAVCSTVAEKQDGDVDHMVRIWWWWDDGKELQEIELLHPHHIVSIKWRPMRGFGSSTTAFRPVLLTCCRDGVVRLWAEIGDLGLAESPQSSRINSEPAVDSDDAGASDSQMKLAFFVSAVIDVNSALKGDLGKNIQVIWPEAGEEGLKSLQSGKDESTSQGHRGSEEARNEWLIGLGPSGSMALWSVQSLDDLSPARGPLIQLWHLRPELLQLPSPGSSNGENESDFGSENSLGAAKIVIHRPHGLIWGPPSSLDIFEIWSPRLLRWHCVWPPAEAIGAPHLRSSLPNRGPFTMTRKRRSWGVSSEIVNLKGHSRNIVQIAIHPSANVMLIASVDDQGHILFWDTSDSFFNPKIEGTGSVNSQWKLCGQLSNERLTCTRQFNSIAWAPVVLRGEDAVLLTCSSERLKCFLISKKIHSSRGKPRSISISNEVLQVFGWPQSADGHGPTGIYALPSSMLRNHDSRSCIVVGVGDREQKLVSWKLDIDVREYSRGMQDSDETAGQTEHAETDARLKNLEHSEDTDASLSQETVEMEMSSGRRISVSLLGCTELERWQHVTCISVDSSARLGESPGFCDLVTGCADGVVRLWKISDRDPAKPAKLTENGVSWQCVGGLKVSRGPVKEVALCSAALKLASLAQSQNEEEVTVQIWGINSLLQQVGFCLEANIEVDTGSFVSLSWFDGVGFPILGVATQVNIQLFSESRELRSDIIGVANNGPSGMAIWTHLASSARKDIETGILSWDLQGTLIVTSGRHILLYSDCVSLQLYSSTKVQSLPGGSIRPKSYYEDQKERRSSSNSNVTAEHPQGAGEEIGLISILGAAETMGSPLKDYHPSSLMSWLCAGRKEYARASVRHLASCLLSVSKVCSLENGRTDVQDNEMSMEVRVPRTPLHKIFQAKEQLTSHEQKFSWSLAPEGNSQFSLAEGKNGFSSSFSSSYMDLSRNDISRGQSSVTSPIKDGGLMVCTKIEMEAITEAVRASAKIPGLSQLEKLQLLAVVDVLAEMDGVGQALQVDSIDLAGQRLWLAVRYAYHFAKWKEERNPNDEELLPVKSKMMAWALQSNSKETLGNLCVPDQSMTWPVMRSVGLGFWLTDGTELRAKMEKLARAQFLKRRDPRDCALLYVALDRRLVLSGLFKLSKDPKDKPLAAFLLRDFKDETHQGAALKNAYVLMGKHRHELAAAFFILGGDNNSAAVVCARNLGDVQLALVICSLLEGVSGPIGKNIILQYGLPNATAAGDVWLASLFQWLLGEGIQCIQELDCSSLFQRSSQDPNSSVGPSNGSPIFPLDHDVGRYCALLASKPRLRSDGAAAARALDLARVAASQSAAALIRCGLHLQALDYLGSCKEFNFSSDLGDQNGQVLSTAGGSSTRSSTSSLTHITGLEVGSGWASIDAAARLHSKLRLNLAIRYASQLLQDHPQWGGRASTAWQDPQMATIYKGLSSEGQPSPEKSPTGNHSSDGVDQRDFIGEADESYANDVQLLQAKCSLQVQDIVMPAIILSQAHRRPYLCRRIVRGLWSYMETPNVGFHLASQLTVSELSAQFLEISGIVAPRALARTVLSLGSSASALASSEGKSSGTMPGRDGQADHSTTPLTDSHSNLLVEELVRFGGEIQRLAKAASCRSPLFSKEKGLRAVNLLAFTFFVAAAWLGRQVEALHALVSSTVMDPSSSPNLPPEDCDAWLWYRRLDLVNRSQRASVNIARGKRPVESNEFNMAGTVTISTDDAWRVLGVSLWTHVLIYVKKQLSGTASEALYNSLGRMPSAQSSVIMKNFQSKGNSILGFETTSLSSTWSDFKSRIREGYQHPYHPVSDPGHSQSLDGGLDMSKLSENLMLTSASDVDDFGGALLSAVTSIVAGLRKQLAAHLKNTLEVSGPDQLMLWLWGKPSPTLGQAPTSGGSSMLNFFGASSSSTQSTVPGATLNSRGQAVIFPTVRIGSQDPLWKELWEVLVVREKVSSALGLEGVNGQRMEAPNGNMSGWYLGRNARALTPQSSFDRINFSPTSNSKPLPKRIMWETAEDMHSGSDQGIILNSKRDETMLARPRTSREVHLSEEFSEGAKDSEFEARQNLAVGIPFDALPVSHISRL